MIPAVATALEVDDRAASARLYLHPDAHSWVSWRDVFHLRPIELVRQVWTDHLPRFC